MKADFMDSVEHYNLSDQITTLLRFLDNSFEGNGECQMYTRFSNESPLDNITAIGYADYMMN